jgi:hypothetical protein
MAERTYFDHAQDVQLESLRRRGSEESIQRSDTPLSVRALGRRQLVFGVFLVLSGLAFALAYAWHTSTTKVVTTQSEAIAPTEARDLTKSIQSGHVISSMALELGAYPPDLAVGDTVMVVVTPIADSNAPTHALNGNAVVKDVSHPIDGSNKVVVSVDISSSVAVELASADSVHLSIIGRAS